MRFRRITLDHFRGVDSAAIEFGDTVTVVEGPNEVGKSTLAEAITVLFDHLDSSRRQDVRAVHQIGADVGPYVELEFTVGDYEVTYAKRFLRKPSTLLRIHAPVPE
ncbi:MAG: AAA family ATPase, partial [Nocardioidaceae bacterium]